MKSNLLEGSDCWPAGAFITTYSSTDKTSSAPAHKLGVTVQLEAALSTNASRGCAKPHRRYKLSCHLPKVLGLWSGKMQWLLQDSEPELVVRSAWKLGTQSVHVALQLGPLLPGAGCRKESMLHNLDAFAQEPAGSGSHCGLLPRHMGDTPAVTKKT